MITLLTGKPGHAKSLLAVQWVRENRALDNPRAVFTNISGLDNDTLGSFTLDDPEKWYELPIGSLVIIDECQRWFRPLPNGSAVPQHIAELETHRHLGIDIVFITQGPKLIHSNVRALVEQHYHSFRPQAMNGRYIYHWNGVNDNPEPKQTYKAADRSFKRFDKSLFALYKSSEEHTHKLRLPKRFLYMGAFALFLVTFSFFGIYSNTMDKLKANDSEELAETEKAEIDSIDSIPTRSLRVSGVIDFGSTFHIFFEEQVVYESDEFGILGQQQNVTVTAQYQLEDFDTYRVENSTIRLTRMGNVYETTHHQAAKLLSFEPRQADSGSGGLSDGDSGRLAFNY